MEMEKTNMFNAALKIVKKLQDNNFSAVFAGGVVRDFLLGLPAKDIDIATSASCEDIEKLFKRTIGVGRQFGVMIVLQDGFEFECAQFRNDVHTQSCKNFEPIS